MLKRDITYTDFDENEVTETFYFNLSRPEIIELEVEYEGGLESFIKRVIDAKDHKSLVAEFKRIILLAVGQRSEDGKRFIKSPEISEHFSQTPAYDVLFMELATDDVRAAEFMNGIVPREVSRAAAASHRPIGTPHMGTQPMTPPPPPQD